jgi:hypothetical protein
MRIIPYSLLLICFAAPQGLASDSSERLRNPLSFCTHFVINDADAAAIESSTNCCRFENQIHDCRDHIWDE